MFIDSNIFCYYFTRSSEFHEPVSRYVDEVLEEESIHISVIVLMEVSHYLVNNLGPIKGKETIETLTSYPIDVVDFDYGLFVDSLDQLARHAPQGIGGRDASILACMFQKNISTLLTHDQAFKSVEEIEVIDPVEQ